MSDNEEASWSLESSEIILHKRGKVISKEEKILIINSFKRIREKMPTLKKTQLLLEVSKNIGIGKHSVRKTLEESQLFGNVVSNQLVRKKDQKSVFEKALSESDKDTIRRIVHDFFKNQQIPTINSVFEAYQQDETLPIISRATLHRLLKKLGFRFHKRERDILKTERTDLIRWREEYISTIRKFRAEGRIIYYTDETWLNANHTREKVWEDTTIKTSREAFNKGLSTGLKNPSGKGKRLIISHIGNENGFLDGGLLCFESKKNFADYHDDMDGAVYEAWFQDILALLQPNDVVVMDNAPYHSVKLEKIPGTGNNKAEIVAWLESKGVPADPSLLKKNLLELVNEIKPQYNHYKIDDMALQKGITVLRLPPYHCQFNPIELIWAQVKNSVGSMNNTFNLNNTRQYLINSLNSVTSQNWKACINHCIQIENKIWREDHPINVEPMIIELNSEESDDDLFV